MGRKMTEMVATINKTNFGGEIGKLFDSIGNWLRSGTRPSFTPAAAPELARGLFDRFVERARAAFPRVGTGRFGADMKVHLINDGPVTFWLQVEVAA